MPIKIIDLQSEDAPSPDDLVVIRDNETQTTRKITRAAFFADPPIGAGAITEEMLGDGAVSKRTLGEDAKIGVRTLVQPSPATLTPNIDDYDVFSVTALNSGMTIANPVGTPLDGQGIMFRIRDNGTARGISWGSQWRSIGVTAPSATVANKMLYVSARWNEPHARWDILSVGRE
jgi:hypothetical protein